MTNPGTFQTKTMNTLHCYFTNIHAHRNLLLTKMFSTLIFKKSRISLGSSKCFKRCHSKMTSSKQPPPRICSTLRHSQSRDVLLASLTRPKKRSLTEPYLAHSRAPAPHSTPAWIPLRAEGEPPPLVTAFQQPEVSLSTRPQSTRAFDEHNGTHCHKTYGFFLQRALGK